MRKITIATLALISACHILSVTPTWAQVDSNSESAALEEQVLLEILELMTVDDGKVPAPGSKDGKPKLPDACNHVKGKKISCDGESSYESKAQEAARKAAQKYCEAQGKTYEESSMHCDSDVIDLGNGTTTMYTCTTTGKCVKGGGNQS